MKPIRTGNCSVSLILRTDACICQKAASPPVNMIKCGPPLPVESTSLFPSDISSYTLCMAHIPTVPHHYVGFVPLPESNGVCYGWHGQLLKVLHSGDGYNRSR